MPGESAGFSFFVLSKKALPPILNIKVTTFYISIVYLIFKLFRGGVVPFTTSIQIIDSVDPSKILTLIDTINMCSKLGKYKQEEELYFLLIDIMRSPELFKEITQSSLKHEDEKKND